MKNKKKIIILLMSFLLGTGILFVGIASGGSLFLKISNKGFQFEKLSESKMFIEKVSNDVRSLQIDVDYIDICMSEGDEFVVAYNPSMITMTEQEGLLIIKDIENNQEHENRAIVSFDFSNMSNSKQAIQLTIPKAQQIEICKMRSVSSNLSIENQSILLMDIENT